MVFKADPGEKGNAEDEIEESFVRDGEDDEDWGEGKEDNEQPVEVMIVWLKAMRKGQAQR